MVDFEEIDECALGDVDVHVKERGLSRTLGPRRDVGGGERFKLIQLDSNQINFLQFISVQFIIFYAASVTIKNRP